MFLQLYIAVYYELLLIYVTTNYIKCDQIVALIISAIWYSSIQCHVCMESAQLYDTTCACKATFSGGEATMLVKLNIILFSSSHNFTYQLYMFTDFTYLLFSKLLLHGLMLWGVMALHTANNTVLIKQLAASFLLKYMQNLYKRNK